MAAIALGVACSAPSETRSPSPASAQVPAQAPDTVPEGFFDPNNLRWGVACITSPVLRGIVVVRFEEGATRAQRQEAIDQVGGEVVGGLASEAGEGFYYVAVEDDPEGERVCEAFQLLESMPQVAFASPSIPDYANRR